MKRVHVGQMVRELLAGCSDDVHGAQSAVVAKVVEGIVTAGSLSPATVGRNLPGTARPKHGIKCVDRLLGNQRWCTNRTLFFRSLASRLLGGCARPVILVDWTHVAPEQVALVAAVPIEGRALPICLEVQPLKKLGNVAIERRFIRSLKTITPSNCRPVIVTDAGFKGPLFKAVVEQGWDFLGRLRGTTKAFASDGRKVSKDELYAKATTTPTDLGDFGLFVKQKIPARLVLVRKRRKPGRKAPPPKNREQRQMRQAARDPWLLATSLSDCDARTITNLYAKRMQIEETFRSAKSHRFGWSFGSTKLSTTHRTAALLTLASLAMAVTTLIGMAAERLGFHRAHQANTSRRRVLSFIRLACDVLKRLNQYPISPRDVFASMAAIAPLVGS